MPILTPEERVGATLAGKYRLDRILATGGMATVFAGVHAWTERAVAVKILNYEHARDPEVVRRFLQEARAAAQLKHPNVVDVLDMGQDDDGTVYLVLELLEGETLKARLKLGALGVPELRSLILPVMRAVASAHAKGVVHRDLKPDNVFLATGAHGEHVPKLLDFGIAKVQSGDSSSTRTGMMVGTPQYMAPEQVRGERDVGPRADVWSMGVVLHYALTRRMPFNADSPAAVLARVLTERARPIRESAPDVPAALAAVVDRSLQHEAESRFADMGEMLRAFEAALDGGAVAPGVSGPETPLERTTALVAPLEPMVPAVGASSLAPPPPVAAPEPQSPAAQFSEYPPAPVTPFSWATPGTTPDEPPPRDARPLLAAGAALVVLMGAASAWLVLGPLADEPAVAASPVAPTPLSTTPPATPVVAQPAVAQPAVAQPAVAQPVVAQPEQPTVTQPEQPTVAQPEQPTVAQPTVAQPTQPERADRPELTRPTLARPASGHDDEDAGVRGARVRRGTRGALILR
jgi:serine/threonine-protein kinase